MLRAHHQLTHRPRLSSVGGDVFHFGPGEKKSGKLSWLYENDALEPKVWIDKVDT